MDTWRQGRGKTVVTVFPFSNETTEHIESQLQAILSEAETWLVESQTVHGGGARAAEPDHRRDRRHA